MVDPVLTSRFIPKSNYMRVLYPASEGRIMQLAASKAQGLESGLMDASSLMG